MSIPAGQKIKSAWAFRNCSRTSPCELLRQECRFPPNEPAIWVDWWLGTTPTPTPASTVTTRRPGGRYKFRLPLKRYPKTMQFDGIRWIGGRLMVWTGREWQDANIKHYDGYRWEEV